MEQTHLSIWTSKPSTTTSMMLDSDPFIFFADKDEVLQFIPSLKGASILELGCGIGRFTGEFSHRARDVTAVDFAQNHVDVTLSIYGHLNNLTLICANMLTVEIAKENFDMVFTAWMFGNSNQHESVRMVERVLDWLKPGGYLFFREANPVNRVLKNNEKKNYPSILRSPLFLDKLVRGVTRNGYALTITHCRNSRTYTTLKEEEREVYYLAQKVPCYTGDSNIPAMAPPPSTLPLPTIKDQNFKAAGVVPGTVVLVLGCGSGGLAMHLAHTCSAFVLGLDSAIADIDIAMRRLHLLPVSVHRMVQFEMIATEDVEFNENSFNVILVRESELRTTRQYRLLSKLRRWLKPGGNSYIINDNTYHDDQPPVKRGDVWVRGYPSEEAAKLENEILTWEPSEC